MSEKPAVYWVGNVARVAFPDNKFRLIGPQRPPYMPDQKPQDCNLRQISPSLSKAESPEQSK